MSNDHNIDRLFQESFKDFEVEAPKNAWQNIENKLSEKSKKPVFPLWQKIGAVAATAAVLMLAGSQWLFEPQISNNSNSVVEAPQEIINTGESPNSPENTQLFSTPSNFEDSRQSRQNEIANTNSNSNPVLNQNTKSSSASQSQTNSLVMASAVASNNTNSNINTNITRTNQKYISSNLNSNSIVSNTINSKSIAKTENQLMATVFNDDYKSNYIASNEQSLVEVAKIIYDEEKMDKSSKEKKSWFVKPQLAPTFYGNLGEGSAIDESLSQNSGQGEVNMSFGVNVAYQINDKIKIRSGVNRVNLNYSTNDVYLIPGSGFASFNNADLNTGFDSSVMTMQQLENLNEEGLLGRFPSESSALQQHLGYIEIPMELEYRLVDRDVNINIVGGASTLFLSNNSIDLRTGDSRTSIGEANNINDVSFSTNFALGFDYDISEKLMLNLEPTFKYQINTFQSGTTNFQPYFFGIYSGVIFKF